MMNQKREDGSRANDEIWCDSLNSEIVEIKGPTDTTVRPMEEWLRKALEKKGVIKPRPTEAPPTPPEQPPS
jgi:hypothetical protein